MTPYSRFLRSLAASAITLADELDAVPVPTPVPVPEPEPTPVPTPDPVPVPVPSPEPVPTPPTKSIFGWNVCGPEFNKPGVPFRNLLAQCNIHFGRADQKPNATFNSKGELITGKANARVIVSPSRVPVGDYQITWTGGGSVSRTQFTVAAGSQTQFIDFDMVGPVAELSCTRVSAPSEQRCSDSFIKRHKGAGVIRLMDQRLTNGHQPANGNHYRVKTTGSNPILEPTIWPFDAHAMANETGCDLWWNVHHADPDSFVRECLVALQGAGQGYKVYVEVSNEVWNDAFVVGKWADAQMNEPTFGRYKWLNRRTKEVARIAKEILGDRAVIVLGSQTTNPGVTAAGLAGGIDGLFDCVAIAPYISWIPSWSGTDAQLIDRIRAYEQDTIRPAVIAQQNLARQHGLRLIAYEGGSDLNEEHLSSVAPQFRRVNRSEAMADLYRSHIEFWRAQVNDVYCFYCDLHDHSYGHFDDELVAPQPRGRVIQEAIAAGATQ